MKQKLSNYIAEKLLASGITDVFMITGGGAMHLDDALGHQEGLHCLYNHHEQACAMAAEAYARIHNKIAAVCVTTGPGGINAMNGVAGGFLDSIPMFVISGQVRYDTTARSTGLHLRAMGDQEYDITKSVANMTKYCEMVIDPMRIRFCVEKALYLAYNGRPVNSFSPIPMETMTTIDAVPITTPRTVRKVRSFLRNRLLTLIVSRSLNLILTGPFYFFFLFR